MDPIFIVGTERSGTNLLRLMLDAHSSICVPHPPHVFKNFFPRLAAYGDLAEDANFRSLVDDVVGSVAYHHYPWDIEIDPEKIFREVSNRDLAGVFAGLYDQYLAFTGKKRWACKSTFMIDHIAEMKQRYPGAKFIYMVRDGRDVALSAKSSIFNRYAVYYSAHLWKREQQVGLYWLNELLDKEILLVKYEDLVAGTESELMKICSFLEESFEPAMLEFFKTAEAQKSSSICGAWENTSKPIMRDNYGKFKKGLSPNEIRVFEEIACDELTALGYEPSTPRRSKTEAPFKISYLLGEYFLMAKAQVRHFWRDKNSILRHRKYRLLTGIDKRVKK